jgi:hypothetical protein
MQFLPYGSSFFYWVDDFSFPLSRGSFQSLEEHASVEETISTHAIIINVTAIRRRSVSSARSMTRVWANRSTAPTIATL